MQANVGPTSAPLSLSSANPAEKRSMSLGAAYRIESFCHKFVGISAGGEFQEQALGMPQNSL